MGRGISGQSLCVLEGPRPSWDLNGTFSEQFISFKKGQQTQNSLHLTNRNGAEKEMNLMITNVIVKGTQRYFRYMK